MNGHRLQSEFAARGRRVGHVIVFDERTALNLIDRAEEKYVAVSAVESVRAEDLASYEPPSADAMNEAERLRSWASARDFVEMLAGRGLYFDVVFESRLATYFARLRHLFNRGDPWTASRSARGGTIQ